MTLHISCDFCGCELTQPGALLFGPPNDRGETLKRHACVSCWEADGAVAERDRRVGAAVREAGFTETDAAYAMAAVRQMRAASIAERGGSVGSVMVVHSCDLVLGKLEAIAAVLQKEANDA